MLRKLMVCGECGQGVCTTGHRNRHGELEHFYLCMGCYTAGRHRISLVDAAVRDALREIILSPERLKSAARALAERKGVKEALAENDRRMRLALAQVDLKQRARERLIKLAGAGAIETDELAEALKGNKTELYAAQAEVRAAEEQRQALEVRQASATALVGAERFRQAMARRVDTFTAEEWRGLVERMFPRGDGYGLRLYKGRIEGRGIVPLSADEMNVDSSSPCPRDGSAAPSCGVSRPSA
jgi:hypothetical protein